MTLTRSAPIRSTDDQGEGLMLTSYDRTLVIKQISSEEVADVHNILSEYHQVVLHSLTHSDTESVFTHFDLDVQHSHTHRLTHSHTQIHSLSHTRLQGSV